MDARKTLFAILFAGVIVLPGCGLIKAFLDHCEIGGAEIVCRPSFEVRSHAAPISAAEVNAFDAAEAVADLGQGNVPILSQTSTATVRLKVNGTTYASNTFTLVRNGEELRAQNPSQVNQWLRAHAVGADSVVLDIDGIRVGEVIGTNVFAIVLEYLGSEVQGATYSWHRSRIGDGEHRRQQ